MVKTILTAIPTDKEAQIKIKKEKGDYGSLSIIAETAKKYLNQSIIKDPHHFVCSTDGCPAPITCCSYRPTNKQATHYRTPTDKRHLHINKCEHSIESYQQSIDSESKAKYINKPNNKSVSSFDPKRGFNEISTPVKKSSIKNEISESANGETKHVSKSKNKNINTQVRNVSTEIGSLKEHIEIFEDNPAYIITSRQTGKEIPIEEMFTDIKNNKPYSDVTSADTVKIHFGEITIYKKSDGDFIGWFNEEVNVGDYSLQPSIFFKEDFIKKQYPEKYKEYQENNVIKCKSYLSYWLYLDTNKSKPYLNFAQFETGLKLSDSTKGLKNNIYLS